MKWVLEWIADNKGLFTGLVVGLVVAILFLTIGFWATLLIAVCVGVGAFIGAHPEVLEHIPDFLKRLFTKPGEQ